jgi:hypothetical protein
MSERTKANTSVSLGFKLIDTNGNDKTGVDVTALKLQFHRPGEAPSTATSLTLLASNTATFQAYGAREVDATNSPGLCRVDCPDAAFATGANEVVLTVTGPGIKSCSRLVDLMNVDGRIAGGKLPVTIAAGDLASGAIDLLQLTSTLKALLVRGHLLSTATTIPPSNDTWYTGGLYNGIPYYAGFINGLYAWNNGTGWTISASVGSNGASYWTSGVNTTVVGPYAPQGFATGVPVVVARGNAVLASFQPDQTLPSAAQVATIPASGTIARSTDIPSAAANAVATANAMFVDGITNALKVNPDHSVGANAAIINYVTIPPAAAAASQTPSVIACLRGDTLRVRLPPMGNLTTRTKLVMTTKIDVHDSDQRAVFQLVESTGLTRVNGSDSVIAGCGSLTVADATTGAVDLVLDASVTATFGIGDLVWDVQASLATGIVSPVSGVMNIVADVTQAIA